MKPCALLFAGSLLLTGCISPKQSASEAAILTKAHRAVIQREAWAAKPSLYVASQDRYDGTWRVTVAKYADVQPTEVASIVCEPGTQRELLFRRDGKLLFYRVE